MKKLFLILISCLMSTMSFAQWTKSVFPADELKGNEAYTAYQYNVAGIGSFIFWSNEEAQYRIINENGIFNYKSGYNKYSGSYRGLTVTVGLYDANNALEEKFEMWLDAPDDKPTFLGTRNAGGMFNPVGQKKKVKKILNHIKNKDGYVRIIAETYGNHADYDLKIPKIDIEL